MSDSDDGKKGNDDDDLPERPSSAEGLEELSYRDLQKLAMDVGINRRVWSR